MFDLILLGIIAALVYRVFDSFIANIEGLFVSKTSKTTVQVQQIAQIVKENIKDKKVSKEHPKSSIHRIGKANNQNNLAQKVMVSEVIPEQIKASQPQIIQQIVEQKIEQKPVLVVDQPKIVVERKVEKINLPHNFIKEQKSSQKQPILSQSGSDFETIKRLSNDNLDLQAEIQKLKSQIQQHKEEKLMYVERIEDIILHVKHSEDQSLNESNEKIEGDEELLALKNLKEELNHSHQTEVQRFQKLQEETQLKHNTEISELNLKLSAAMIELTNHLQKICQLQSQNQNLARQINESKRQIQMINQQRQSALKYIELSQNQRVDLKATTNLQEEKKIEQGNNVNLLIAQYQDKQSQYEKNIKQLQQTIQILQNDRVQQQIKYSSQINSLSIYKNQLQIQITSLKQAKLQNQLNSNEQIKEFEEKANRKHQQQVFIICKEKDQAIQKLQQAQQQLKFASSQLKMKEESQIELKAEIKTLKESNNTPKRSEKKQVTTADVQNHSQFLKLKRKVQELESQGSKQKPQMTKAYQPLYQTTTQSSMERRVNYARPVKQREVSPSFQMSPTEKNVDNGQYESKYQTGSSKDKRPASTIFSAVDRMKQPIDLRYKTPMIQSSIFEGGITSESHFGESSFLSEMDRLFIINEINRLKKISAKKTRLLYRSLNSNNKNITEYITNVPNLIVIVKLSSSKIIAAFTQAAFNKQLNSSPERKYVSANKAMLMDVTGQNIIINATGSDTIRYDENSLIWGRNEFVVGSLEPRELYCDLNCQNAIYPTQLTNQAFLGNNTKKFPIQQFEVYRVFLG